MATGYEFLGLKETLAAYESRGLEQWAIFSGNRFIMKGEGIDALGQFLAMISRSNTTATYTLKVYEQLGEKERINSKTPDDGSFNFKLFDLYGNSGTLSGIIPTHYGDPGQVDPIKKAIREVLEEMEPGEPEPPTILEQMGDAFIGMLQEPRKLSEFIGALTGQPPPRHIVGTTTAAPPREVAGSVDLSEESLLRIGAAIEKMGAVDPDIVKHLEKLAEIAQGDPGRFKMLIALLDGV